MSPDRADDAHILQTIAVDSAHLLSIGETVAVFRLPRATPPFFEGRAIIRRHAPGRHRYEVQFAEDPVLRIRLVHPACQQEPERVLAMMVSFGARSRTQAPPSLTSFPPIRSDPRKTPMDMRDVPTSPQAGPFTKIAIWIAGADEELLRLCPPRDWDNVRAVATIMICTWIYQAALFSMIGHRLFASPGQIRPELMLASAFIASFILLIDSYMVMRSGWHLSGIEELKRGGLDTSGGPLARIKAGVFLTIRILLSMGIAQLMAVFLSLLVFDADINARVQSGYLQANARLLPAATALVDGEIQRATDAVTAAATRAAALSAQVAALRQNEIDPTGGDPQVQQAQQELNERLAEKTGSEAALHAAETFASDELGGIKGTPGNSGLAGNGPRRKAALEEMANAREHARTSGAAVDAARERLDNLRRQLAAVGQTNQAQAHDRLPAFEQDLADENAGLARAKDQLTQRLQGRNEAIRHAVETAPDHVAVDNGLIAQLSALERIAEGDGKIAAVIGLIDFVSFGFELAAVLAKVTSYVPTTYAALLASQSYLSSVRIVDDLIAKIDGAPDDGAAAENGPLPAAPSGGPRQSNDHPLSFCATSGPDPFAAPDGAPQPPKRPRGRPRKSPLN